jgi:CheY-like chemotaxis protein
VATILLVDDYDVNRDVIRTILEAAGYEVIEASSQDGALAAATGALDLAIVDVMLRLSVDKLVDSDTLGGIKVIRQLRQNPATHELPVVVLTKRGDRDTVLGYLRPYAVQGYIEISGSTEEEIVAQVEQALR